MGAGVAGDQRARLRSAATSQKPASLRWLRSIEDAQLGAARRRARRPRRSGPGPMSGRGGEDERHAVSEGVGAAPDRAERAQARPRTSGRAPRGRGRSPRRPRGGARRPAARPRSRRGVDVGDRAGDGEIAVALERGAGARRRAPPRRGKLVVDRARPAAPIGAALAELALARAVRGGGGEDGEDAAPIPPARIRGRSRWPPLRPLGEVRVVGLRQRVVVTVEDREHAGNLIVGARQRLLPGDPRGHGLTLRGSAQPTRIGWALPQLPL